MGYPLPNYNDHLPFIVSIHHFYIVGCIIFCIGLFGVLTRKNAIAVLISLELMMVSASLNFAAFNTVHGVKKMLASFTGREEIYVPIGQVFALFVIVIAACEVAVGLAIILAYYRARKSANLTDANSMRW
jgi:NADH:ubiquinone oxidoreductase subunit K